MYRQTFQKETCDYFTTRERKCLVVQGSKNTSRKPPSSEITATTRAKLLNKINE